MKTFVKIIVLGIILAPITLQAQLKKYSNVNKVARNSYNFVSHADCRNKQKKDKSLYIVYSDRNENNAYLDNLGLQQGEKQQFLNSYYVIDEDRDFLELVKFDPEKLGKPKGLFSYFYSGKYNFKKAEQKEYVGWIHRDNLLHYSHPILSKKNFRPIQFVLGFNDLRSAYNPRDFIEKDSVKTYTDPKFKNRTKKSLNLHQFVYVYKYNTTGNAALVSNMPHMHASDSTKRIVGWVPTKMIKEIGQRQAYHLKEKDTITLAETNKKTTYSTTANDVYKQFLLRKENYCLDSPTDSTAIQVIHPLYIWNHRENKLINVKGGDLYMRDIPKIKEENRHINFHLIFDCNPKLRNKLKYQIASLQRIWLLISQDTRYQDYHFTFSANSYGCNLFYEFPKQVSFSNWIDYLQRIVQNDPKIIPTKTNREGIEKCFKKMLYTSDLRSFENNIVLVIGENNLEMQLNDKKGKPLIIPQNVIARLAQSSSRLLFFQLENKSSDAHQKFILESKKILDAVGTYYQQYIQHYLVDNKMVKKRNVFTSIENENSNVYLYDAPVKSMYTGGIVFPKLNQSLSPAILDLAIDSVLHRTMLSNDKLLQSLQLNIDKLGFLRSKPSNRMSNLMQSDKKYYGQIAFIPKINKEELYLEEAHLNLFKNNQLVSGQLLTKNEINTLAEAYKSVVPLLKTTANRKDRINLRSKYKDYVKQLNKILHFNELSSNNTVAKLLYVKGGVPVKNKILNTLRIKDLHKSRKLNNIAFTDLFQELRNKIDALELATNNSNTIQFTDSSGTTYYFIPDQKLF